MFGGGVALVQSCVSSWLCASGAAGGFICLVVLLILSVMLRPRRFVAGPGSVVLLSGGSMGIGKSLAVRRAGCLVALRSLIVRSPAAWQCLYAAAGAHVIILARGKPALEAAAVEIATVCACF